VNDPRRIREVGSDAPEELRELFRSARKPAPLSPAAQAMLSSRVTAMAAAPVSGLVRWLPWLLGGAVAVAGAAAVRTRVPEPLPRAPSAFSAAPPTPVAPVPPPEPALAPVPAVPSARAEAARQPASLAPTRGEAQDALVGEARLLNEAHQALANNPKKAFLLAQDHERRYPRGQLAAERELIQIQALVKLGRQREAEARGRALRRTAPNSIYDQRLDEILQRK
jgi:hypothetical protein